MNMLGVITPSQHDDHQEPESLGKRLIGWAVRMRMLLGVVVLPAVIVGGYLFLIASDQYLSEAHFLVRSAQGSSAPTPGLSQALSMVTGSGSPSNEAMSVADYLTSHDVVDTLRREDRLVERFSRSDIDFFDRLRTTDPTPEKLLKYYQQQVKIKLSTETGITIVQVRAFRPEDSFAIVRKLLVLGEQRVNVLNVRSYEDALASARRQLADAERDLAAGQQKSTAFRQSSGDIDPKASGEAQIALVGQLKGQLAAAQAQLSSMGRMISNTSPQYQALEARVRALQAQVGAQEGRLAGTSNSIASDVSGYENLQIRQQFLAKRFDAAASALERAREQAQRQQLYLVRVVDPNMPVKALYPERWRIFFTWLLALLLAYAIFWLLAAGVREHAS